MSLKDDGKVHSRTVVPIKDKAKLILSKEVVMKIHYLHTRVKNNTEWSGILVFNTKEGSIDNPANWVLEAEDFIFMDVGTGAYTEYDFDTDDTYSFDKYTDAMAEGKRLGHIHTHHNMKTFFSGTDMSELHENAPNHSYYVSLIVNYKEPDEWCAKVAFVGEEKVSGTITRTKNSLFNLLGFGSEVTETIEKVVPILYTIDLDLELAEEIKPFYDRVTEICTPKVVKRAVGRAVGASTHHAGWHGGFRDWDLPTLGTLKSKTPTLFDKKEPEIQRRPAGLYSKPSVMDFLPKLAYADLQSKARIGEVFKTATALPDVHIEILVEQMEENFEDYIADFFAINKLTDLDTFCVALQIIDTCTIYDDTYLYNCLSEVLAVYLDVDRDAEFDKKVMLLTNLKDTTKWAAMTAI